MKFQLSSKHNAHHFSREAVLVLLLGLVIRIFALYHTFIIVPDGVLYIHQARALYYGQWGALTSCGLSYLSNYPIFIAGVYTILHNWVMAAMWVSLFFGSLTLIPIYVLMRQFFDERISVLGTLMFALIPVFVGRSVDVIRDPTYWFFLVLGLFLFVRHIDNKNHLYLFMSSISYLIASWARIEAFLFIIVSCMYLLAVRQENKIKKLSVFVSPILFLLIIAISGASLFHVSINKFHRVNQVPAQLTGAVEQYQNLREQLRDLANQQPEGVLKYFLPEARHTVWLIAFGVLLNRALEAFFYPYFLVFLIGTTGLWGKVKRDPRVLYCTFLTVSGLILLYVHILQSWMMFYRFLAIVIFPSFIFAGFGLEKITDWVQHKFNFKKSAACSMVCFLILIAALPKNLQKRGANKVVFKQIATVIAKREGGLHVTKISTSMHTQRWISFYTNLDYKGAPCPDPDYDHPWDKYAKDYGKLLLDLTKRGVGYFLWEEKNWPDKTFNVNHTRYRRNFIPIGKWYHPDTGQMILYAVH